MTASVTSSPSGSVIVNSSASASSKFHSGLRYTIESCCTRSPIRSSSSSDWNSLNELILGLITRISAESFESAEYSPVSVFSKFALSPLTAIVSPPPTSWSVTEPSPIVSERSFNFTPEIFSRSPTYTVIGVAESELAVTNSRGRSVSAATPVPTITILMSNTASSHRHRPIRS